MAAEQLDIREDPVDVLPDPNRPLTINLADDKELVKKVQSRFSDIFSKYVSDRSEQEKIWEFADYAFKCGYDESKAEEERGKQDRNGTDDNLTKTKAQKIGSTMFYRAVRDLAAILIHVVLSKKDPYAFRSKRNSDVQFSDLQGDDVAMQRNLVMRWTRDNDQFIRKVIEFAFMLCKYGNQPVCMFWKRRWEEVPYRKPRMVLDENMLLEVATKAAELGQEELLGKAAAMQPPTKIEGFEEGFEWKLVSNLPTIEVVPNENLYADQSIGDMQKQTAFIITTLENMADMYDGARDGRYINVEKINESHRFVGRWRDDQHKDRETHAGFESNTDDTQVQLFEVFNFFAYLPIDDSKPEGKRWDEKKHEAKKYWCTLVGTEDDNVCLKIARLRSPMNKWPVEMVSIIPDDSDRLYKTSPAQLVRGNFNEATTAKKQAIDQKTLQNNRPLKRVRGEVFTDDLKFGSDKVYDVEKADSLTEFQISPVFDNMNMVQYLDGDTDNLLALGPAARGMPMGSRTSSTEATNAYSAASKPHTISIRYVLDKLLRFHAEMGSGLWDLNAPADLTLSLGDSPVAQEVQPALMAGDFNVEVTLVDEFEENEMQVQNLTFAAQNLMPLFIDVLDKRELAKITFDKFLKLDVSKMITPDDSVDVVRVARYEQEKLKVMYIPPNMGENYDIHLREHKGELVKLNGATDGDPALADYAARLQRHVDETTLMKQAGAAQNVMASASPMATPGNTTPGMVMGNQIAGMIGARQNG